jgi:hypothetical protein
MIESIEAEVRHQAECKGLALVPVLGNPAQQGGAAAYQLVVPDVGARIYPPGTGAEGAPLHDIQDWLSFPWE